MPVVIIKEGWLFMTLWFIKVIGIISICKYAPGEYIILFGCILCYYSTSNQQKCYCYYVLLHCYLFYSKLVSFWIPAFVIMASSLRRNHFVCKPMGSFSFHFKTHYYFKKSSNTMFNLSTFTFAGPKNPSNGFSVCLSTNVFTNASCIPLASAIREICT